MTADETNTVSNTNVPSYSTAPNTQQNTASISNHNGNGSGNPGTYSVFDRDISQCSRNSPSVFIYDYPWEQVVASYMLRFPKHALLPVLLNSELVSDHVDPETRTRTLIRNCTVDVEAPGWLKKAVGVESLAIQQITVIDPGKRFMRIMNFNEVFKDKALFGDDCCFKVDENDPSKTCFTQYAFCSIPKLPFAKQVEKIMVKNYDKHAAEGRYIDLAMINECLSGGVWKSLSTFGEDMVLLMPCEFRQKTLKPQKKQRPLSQDITTPTRKPMERKQVENLSSPYQLRAAGRPDSNLDQIPALQTREKSNKREPLLWVIACCFTLPLAQSFVLNSMFGIFASSFIYTGLVCAALLCHIATFKSFWIDLTKMLHGEQQEITRRPILPKQQSIAKPVESNTSSAENLSLPEKIDKEKQDSVATRPPPREEKHEKQSSSSSTHSEHQKMFQVSNLAPTDPFSGLDCDTDSYDSEDAAEIMSHHHTNDVSTEEDDEDFDEDELKEAGFESDEEFDVSSFLAVPMEDDAGDEFSTSLRLRDLVVRCPIFIEKSITANGLVSFVVETTLPNGQRRIVERLYTDFVHLRKYFLKHIPQCKVVLTPTLLPKKKSNQLVMGSAYDERRLSLETYLTGLLSDEAVGKLGQRILIEFLRRKGPLIQSTGLKIAKKRFFGSSLSGSHTQLTEQMVNPTMKTATIFIAKWRTCLKETKILLEKNTNMLKIFCRLPSVKEPHCVINIDDIERIVVMADGGNPNEDNREHSPATRLNLPMPGDKYCFFEIATNSGDSYYFCATKETVTDWISEIENSRQGHHKKGQSNTKSILYRRHSISDALQVSDFQLVLNRSRVLFVEQPLRKSLTELATELLNTILSIFQEYTENKCIMSPKIRKRLQKFNELSCELQIKPLMGLSSHSEKLSFFLNIYHTMIVHAHLELGLETLTLNSKRVKTVMKTVSYDLGNQLFSLQDLEHSILRAKMSRPTTLNNSLISQYLSPRFSKRDPRNRWSLTQQDPRINFVLNCGTKSSIYNIWVFSSNADLLNVQLDHASTHFLNEQINIDSGKAVIFLPRICQIYANDLGGSKSNILKTLVNYMPIQMEREIKQLARGEKSKLKVKYHDYDWAWRGVFFRGHDTLSEDMEGCRLRSVKSTV